MPAADAQAKFTAMVDGDQSDWTTIIQAQRAVYDALPDRMLGMLRALKEEPGAYQVDRYEHSLQTATRAFKAGRDEEYVVCALMHDAGDLYAPANHAELSAMLLKPFISEQNYWMMDRHAVFQGYYFFHHLGLDRDLREQYRGHPWFEYTAQFCHLYDQNSFDPEYVSMPLEAFEPMLRRVLSTPKHSVYLPAAQAA